MGSVGVTILSAKLSTLSSRWASGKVARNFLASSQVASIASRPFHNTNTSRGLEGSCRTCKISTGWSVNSNSTVNGGLAAVDWMSPSALLSWETWKTRCYRQSLGSSKRYAIRPTLSHLEVHLISNFKHYFPPCLVGIKLMRCCALALLNCKSSKIASRSCKSWSKEFTTVCWCPIRTTWGGTLPYKAWNGVILIERWEVL